MPTCNQCGKAIYAILWDDDDYMCGACLAGQVTLLKNRPAGRSAHDATRTLTKKGTSPHHNGNDVDLPSET